MSKYISRKFPKGYELSNCDHVQMTKQPARLNQNIILSHPVGCFEQMQCVEKSSGHYDMRCSMKCYFAFEHSEQAWTYEIEYVWNTLASL